MGPFKCPDCGIWWAGLEHRCRQAQTGTGGIAWTAPADPMLRCNCPESGTSGSCPIHDIQTTLTGGIS